MNVIKESKELTKKASSNETIMEYRVKDVIGEYDIENNKYIMYDEEINLHKYATKDLVFAGCDPVIAEAIRKNKSILCETNCGDEQNICIYEEFSLRPYIDMFGDRYSSAKPIIKTKEMYEFCEEHQAENIH